MEKTTTYCPHCQQLQHRVTTMETELTAQRAEITRLQQQLAAANKNSSTSSKPPSSDIVKPPPAPTQEGPKRSPGGQPGHDRHDRPLLPVEQLTEGCHTRSEERRVGKECRSRW